ncbi:hypothetical protein [Photobacterium rosenbergii]|nr:hypothetical protein [Photobacterium rosenbergii]
MFRTEYNGCKSFGCENLGNPDLSLYTPSTRLGYPAYFCPSCGAYPPKLLNQPILGLAYHIDRQRHNAISQFAPQCKCQQSISLASHNNWRLYDKTRIGTLRVQCRHCHTVASLTNPQKLANTLQPLMALLESGTAAGELLTQSNLNKKLFYQRLHKLALLLETFSALYEEKWLNEQQSLSLHTRSHVLRCRSGLTSVKHLGLDCWLLSTVDNQTGYQFLISDNLLPQSKAEQDLGQACEELGEYTLDEIEQPVLPSHNILETAKQTYHKIMSRQQFDKLAYCTREFAKSNEGTLLRPVYAAHAHMQNLRLRLSEKQNISLVLEHESFIRGAAITAFADQVKPNTAAADGAVNLYYLHTFRCQSPASLAGASASNTKKLSWWHEKWHQFSHQYQNDHWQLGIGVLTQNAEIDHSLIQTVTPTRPDWHQQFWYLFDMWLPASARKKISHAQLVQLISIFRYIYNFSGKYISSGLYQKHEDCPIVFDWCSVERLAELVNQQYIK